jgi:protein phosphatase
MELQATGTQFGVSFAAITHVGMRRANNQDSVRAAPAGTRQQWQTQGHVFVVADGMGAHAAGELASKLATDLLVQTYRKLENRPPEEALVEAIQEANQQIHQRGQADDEFRGMGTTVCALVLFPDQAILANVGDSRIYRLRDGNFEQLTFDHSLVWELQAAQLIGTDEEQLAYIPKNVITRSLGPHPEVKVDIHRLPDLRPGDVFVLCSDGLSGPVADDKIGKVVSLFPPDEAARLLVHLANYHGGPDNISVIVVRVDEVEPSEKLRVRHGRSAVVQPLLLGGAAGIFLVLLGAAVISWLRDNSQKAILYFALAALAGIGLLLAFLPERARAWWKPRKPAGAARGAGPEGKFQEGPYRTYRAVPDEEFVAYLSQVAEALAAKGKQEQWPVDWKGFDEWRQGGEACRAKGDFGEAARCFGRSICSVMNQLFSKAVASPNRRWNRV